MRKETRVAPSGRPSSRVTASTASTGEAASAASSMLATALMPPVHSISGA